MANTVRHKRSSVAAAVPTAAQIAVGELAINFSDKKLFTKDAANTVIELGNSKWTTTGSDIYRNSKVAVGGTAAPVSQFDLQTGTAAGATVAVAASALDLALGQVFTKTIAAATTFTFANVPAGRATTAVLHLTNGGSAVITWPASVKWPSGTAPTLTAAGVDVIVLNTTDGGTTWRGNVFGKDIK